MSIPLALSEEVSQKLTPEASDIRKQSRSLYDEYQLVLKFEGQDTSKRDNLPEERKNLPMNDGNMIQEEDNSLKTYRVVKSYFAIPQF
jgi:hypothetical protein